MVKAKIGLESEGLKAQGIWSYMDLDNAPYGSEVDVVANARLADTGHWQVGCRYFSMEAVLNSSTKIAKAEGDELNINIWATLTKRANHWWTATGDRFFTTDDLRTVTVTEFRRKEQSIISLDPGIYTSPSGNEIYLSTNGRVWRFRDGHWMQVEEVPDDLFFSWPVERLAEARRVGKNAEVREVKS